MFGTYVHSCQPASLFPCIIGTPCEARWHFSAGTLTLWIGNSFLEFASPLTSLMIMTMIKKMPGFNSGSCDLAALSLEELIKYFRVLISHSQGSLSSWGPSYLGLPGGTHQSRGAVLLVVTGYHGQRVREPLQAAPQAPSVQFHAGLQASWFLWESTSCEQRNNRGPQ